MSLDLAQPITHRRVLQVSLPIILMGLSTPLLGLVDTGIIGQLGQAHLIGAVALGGLIFGFLFWAFGFLRMGTTGLTAQAFGANDADELRATLGRALLIAAIAGLVLILAQFPLKEGAFWLLQGSEAVETEAALYFNIRMWSAPFTLANYAILGWFVGTQRTRSAMVLQIFLNSLNAALDALFVLWFDWGVTGIAAGTVIAEITTALAGLVWIYFLVRTLPGNWAWSRIASTQQIMKTIAVNRDIMIRTLLLMICFTFFTMEGARNGDIILATNAILMQFVTFSAFFLDGFAYTAEAFVGAAIGGRRRQQFVDTVRLTSLWAALLSLALGAGILMVGGLAVDILTTEPSVRVTARAYLPWVAVLPIVSFSCYQIDGIFIGATRTADMRNAAFVSTASFFLFWWLLLPFGNHGLWVSLLLFNIARAVALGAWYPRLLRSLPEAGAARP